MDSIPKPIETRYNGYRFRSRLEARWAVFFDVLGTKYEYEKQDHRLPNGTRYLPDFWLPETESWVEIKGQPPTEEERQKAGLLAATTGQWVDIFWPGPGPELQVYGYRDSVPEHRAPTTMIYVDLAISCGDWWVALTLMRAERWVYWGERLEQVRKGLGWPVLYPGPGGAFADLSYREMPFSQLRGCPDCSGLVFGQKDRPDPMCPGDTIGYPGFCMRPACRDALAGGGDPTHPRLLAALTAARQARFEFGESGARR